MSDKKYSLLIWQRSLRKFGSQVFLTDHNRTISFIQADVLIQQIKRQIQIFRQKKTAESAVLICADNTIANNLLIIALIDLNLPVVFVNPHQTHFSKLPYFFQADFAGDVVHVSYGAYGIIKANRKNESTFHDKQQIGPVDLKPGSYLFTSGSSGLPKLVHHEWNSHFFNAWGVASELKLSQSSGYLHCLPIYHVSGLSILFRALFSGTSLFIPPAGKFNLENASTVLRLIAEHKISHFSFVQAQLKILIDFFEILAWIKNKPDSEKIRNFQRKEYKQIKSTKYNKKNQDLFEGLISSNKLDLSFWSNWKPTILLGGSSISATLIKKSLEHKWITFQGYALTEMASTVAVKTPNRPWAKVLPFRKVTVQAETLHLNGTVLAQTIYQAHHSKPDTFHFQIGENYYSTLFIKSAHRAYDSGDLGEVKQIDQSRYLTVSGRKDGRIICGGENIQPEQIEAIVMKNSNITRAMVVAVDDEYYGQIAVAVIDAPVLSENLLQALETSIAAEMGKFFIPKQFFAWPAELQESVDAIKVSRKQMQLWVRANLDRTERR